MHRAKDCLEITFAHHCIPWEASQTGSSKVAGEHAHAIRMHRVKDYLGLILSHLCATWEDDQIGSSKVAAGREDVVHDVASGIDIDTCDSRRARQTPWPTAVGLALRGAIVLAAGCSKRHGGARVSDQLAP